jgi:hypothetical protein
MTGLGPTWVAFFVREDGAVTVDWVVLTAAIVGLAILVITPVATETESMTANTSDYIDGISVGFMSQ